MRELAPKFALVRMFSLIVPPSFNHSAQLHTLKPEDFLYLDADITDEHFQNVSTQLISGKAYLAKIFKINFRIPTRDCLALYAEEKALFTGAQGLSLVCQIKKEEIPKDRWLFSFDTADALWRDSNKFPRVPRAFIASNGVLRMNLDRLDNDWYRDDYVLCICERE